MIPSHLGRVPDACDTTTTELPVDSSTTTQTTCAAVCRVSSTDHFRELAG